MPAEYLALESDLVRGRASGIVTEREVIDAIDDAVRKTNGAVLRKNVMTVLTDGVSLSQIGIDSLERIKAHIEGWLKAYPGGDFKSAFVASDPSDTRLLLLWKALIDAYPTIGRHVQVFRTESDALAWMAAKD